MKFSNAKLRFWLGLAAAAIALGLSAAAQATQTDIASSPRVEQGPRDPGSKIAFTRVEIAVPGFEDSNEAEIWTMNGDGSEPRRLTNNATFDLGAVWSPNGKTVAFYGYDVEAPDPHVFLINADGGEQTQLTEMRGRFPSWSASGKIAFDNAAGDIFAVNPDGSGLERLTNDPAARNIRPDWSPNGQKIAFTTRRDGNDEIYSMNADGTEPTRLTFDPAADNAPAWSPDGERIVFQRNVGGGNTEIYSMKADGTDQTRLTDYHGRDQDADWSPNGRTIVFERDIEPISDGTLQLFTMNADGLDPTPFTGLPSENSHPGWGRGPAGEP
jgi:tol-pal system beta propeller repeat protein TolB